MAQRLPGVEDVVEQQHVAATDVGQQFRANVQLARLGRRAAVARCLDQTDPQRQINLSDQVGEKNQTAGENADDGDGSSLIVGGNLSGQLRDPSLNAIGGKKDLHAAWPYRRGSGKTILNTKNRARERQSSASLAA